MSTNPTRDRFLAEARKYVDKVHEEPPGSNRTEFGREYAQLVPSRPDGEAWCDKAVSIIARRAGVATSAIPNSAYVPGRLDHARAKGWVVTTPEPGDLVVFDFPTKTRRADGVPDHIGILVRAPKGGVIVTLEGNTSSDERGSQDDGDGFYLKHRSTTLVAAYIRPPWPKPAPTRKVTPGRVAAAVGAAVAVAAGAHAATPSSPAPPKPAPSTTAPRATSTPSPSAIPTPPRSVRPARHVAPAASLSRVLRHGTKGEDVKAAQQRLGVRVNGIFDRTTLRAVDAFQRRHGLLVDGVIGPRTAVALGLHWAPRG